MQYLNYYNVDYKLLLTVITFLPKCRLRQIVDSSPDSMGSITQKTYTQTNQCARLHTHTHRHAHTTTIHIQADVLFVSSHCITTRANLYGQEHTCTHTPTHTRTHTTVRRYRQTLYGVRDSSSTASSKRRRRPKREHRNEATVEQSSRVQC